MALNEASPAVRLELDSRPETLTLVRGVLAGVAELIGLDPELLDDLKTAVSEACNNVVMHAYGGETGPLEVRMSFAGERDGKPLLHLPTGAGPDEHETDWLSGDAVVSLSPISLLAGVLGRVARALAARARFSLDRFSDVYLVTDAIAAHAARAAKGARMSFAISTDAQRLQLTIGPFVEGSGEQLSHQAPDYSAASALTMLTDELEIRRNGEGEILYVVMVDRRRT